MKDHTGAGVEQAHEQRSLLRKILVNSQGRRVVLWMQRKQRRGEEERRFGGKEDSRRG